jgi:hypothetical protein
MDSLLAEMRGVVLSADVDTVHVKLGEGTVVQFPREAVPEELVQVGMPIHYRIHKRPNGIRFQEFLQGTPTGTKEGLDELNAVLVKVPT